MGLGLKCKNSFWPELLPDVCASASLFWWTINVSACRPHAVKLLPLELWHVFSAALKLFVLCDILCIRSPIYQFSSHCPSAPYTFLNRLLAFNFLLKNNRDRVPFNILPNFWKHLCLVIPSLFFPFIFLFVWFSNNNIMNDSLYC